MAHTSNEFVTATGVRWDDPEEGKTWLVSLISVIILAALVVVLSVLYFQQDIDYRQEKVVDESYLSLQRNIAAQKATLTQSGPYTATVSDKPIARQRVPITAAMKDVVANPKLAIPPVPPPGSAAAAAPAAAPAKKQ